MSRFVGRIKWFAESEGYGFIELPGSSDIFLHYTTLEDDFRIEPGGLVEFEIIQGRKDLVTLAAIFVNVQQARDVYVYEQKQSKVTSTPTASPTSTPVATPGKRRKR